MQAGRAWAPAGRADGLLCGWCSSCGQCSDRKLLPGPAPPCAEPRAPSSSALSVGVPRVCTELQSGPREAAGPCASPHPLPAPLPVPRALGCASSLLSRKAAQASSCLCQMPLCVCLVLHLHLREKEQGPRMDKQLRRGKSAAAGELGGRAQACCAVEAQGQSSRGRGRAGPTYHSGSLST